MERTEKVAGIQSEIEARLVDRILSEQGIPHIMRSYHDSAYDGLFQGPGGWGHVEAPRNYHPQIEKILAEVRRSKRNGQSRS